MDIIRRNPSWKSRAERAENLVLHLRAQISEMRIKSRVDEALIKSLERSSRARGINLTTNGESR